MNMFYVQTVIHNFRQIQVLNPEKSANIRSRILHLAVSRGGRDVSDKTGVWIFAFNSERERAFTLLSEFLFTTKDILDQSWEFIRGYTLVVEPLEGDLFSVTRRLQKSFLLTKEENGIWTALGSDLFLNSGLPLKKSGDLFGLAGPLSPLQSNRLDWKGASGYFSWAEDLMRLTMVPGQRIRIRSGKPEALTFLYRWFSSDDGDSLPPCFFYRPGTMADFAGPLVMGLDPGVIAQIPGELDGADQKVWSDNLCWKTLLSPQVLNFHGDCLDSDLVKALEFWFRTARKTKPGRPKVLILQEPSAWERHSRDILEQLLSTDEIRNNWILLTVDPPSTDHHGEEHQWDWTKVVLSEEGREKLEEMPLFFRMLSPHPQGTPEPEFLRSLRVRKTLMVIDRCCGLLRGEDVISILKEAGEDPLVMEDVLARLLTEGLIMNSHGLIPANHPWSVRSSLPADEQKLLDQSMGKRLFAKWEGEGHPYSEAYAGLLFSLGFLREGLIVLDSYLDHRIAQLSWNSAAAIQGDDGQPPHCDFLQVLRKRLPSDLPSPWKEQLILTAASAKLRFALAQSPRKWELHHLSNFTKNFTPATPQESSGEWLLQTGRFQLAAGKIQEGFALIKKAYMAAQGLSNPSLQVRSGIELGLVFLRRGRASEAWEYFDMAGRLAETKGLSGEWYRSGLYEAASRLLWGNVSGCLGVLEGLKHLASTTGLHSWYLFHQFLEGRSYYELGRYGEAAKIFTQGAEEGRKQDMPKAVEVFLRWRGRSLVYGGNTREGSRQLSELLPCWERNYFLAEAHYFSGELKEALGLLNLEDGKEEKPVLQGRLYWNSGFSLLEDLCLQSAGEQSLLKVLLEGFRAHVLGQMGESDRAVGILQQLVTGQNMPSINPYLPLLLFWWAAPMVRQKSGPEAFHSTLLGRGLKELQTRGSRLQNREDRFSYFQKSYWNSAYLSEAKKYKLA